MVIKQNFENIIVQVFEEKYRQALYDFNLNERQQIYSSLPKDVLDDGINDEDRIAN
ncbi:MAG: GNAT family N-acetyltransferase, partial [Staphylococcus xylosus]|nr:GNAT family N-acetyltransferase [Staphylococcus xylosus]